MNIAASAVLGLSCLALPLVQTQDLGQGVFFNEEGALSAGRGCGDRSSIRPRHVVAYLAAAGNTSAKARATSRDSQRQGIRDAHDRGVPSPYNGGQNDWGSERAARNP
jgi:hypothetical protein